MDIDSLGPLLIDIEGTELSSKDRQLLQHPLVAGVVLFDRNCLEARQVSRLCKQIHALRSGSLLITIDQEGGRVQRLRNGVTLLPQPRSLGDFYDQDPVAAQRLACDVAWVMASELLLLGVDASFSPVLDLDLKSKVIGTRAFHRDPKAVTALGIHWINGMREAGMAAVGKHFPGHGGVVEDSHHERPVDRRDLSTVLDCDGVPFRHVIEEGVEAIMMSHVVYESASSDPASLSPFWVKEVLREQFGFSGVVVADDLSMDALTSVGDLHRRAELALAAGCDLLPVCNNRLALLEMLSGRRNLEDDPASARRRTSLRARARRGCIGNEHRRVHVGKQIAQLNLGLGPLGDDNGGK